MSVAGTQGASGRIGAGSLKATRNSLFCVTNIYWSPIPIVGAGAIAGKEINKEHAIPEPTL